MLVRAPGCVSLCLHRKERREVRGCPCSLCWATVPAVAVSPSQGPRSHQLECSPLGSPVHGILQARILGWVSISYSRVSP